jgi:hypothetical protein
MGRYFLVYLLLFSCVFTFLCMFSLPPDVRKERARQAAVTSRQPDDRTQVHDTYMDLCIYTHSVNIDWLLRTFSIEKYITQHCVVAACGAYTAQDCAGHRLSHGRRVGRYACIYVCMCVCIYIYSFILCFHMHAYRSCKKSRVVAAIRNDCHQLA